MAKATVSRSVDYQETAGCDQKPVDCPQTTSQAKLSLNGTPDAGASLYGGVDSIRLHGPLRNHFCDQLQMPFVYDARQALGTPKKVAFAVPRKQLLDPQSAHLADQRTDRGRRLPHRRARRRSPC